MTCKHSTQVQRYYDGECLPSERLQTEAHLERCPECRELLSDLRGLSRIIGMSAAAPLPEGLVERAVQRERNFEDRAILRIAGWLTATAAGILLAAVASWPANGTETASQSDTWESLAIVPAGVNDDPDAELLIMAQWMDHDLSSNESELR